MDDKQVNIPYIAFESEMTRMERANHRLWVMCIVLAVIVFATNIGWILYQSQYEFYTETTTEVTQDSGEGGVNRFIGGDYYGETENQDY